MCTALKNVSNIKIFRYKLLQKYAKFLVLRFYWFGFDMYFDLVQLLAVPTIVYINLAEPIM